MVRRNTPQPEDPRNEEVKHLRAELSGDTKRSVLFTLPILTYDVINAFSPAGRAKIPRWVGTVVGATGVVGLASMIKAYRGRNKVEALEREIKNDPLPAPVADAPEQECVPCQFKKYRAEPKTLAEHAQSSESNLRQL